MASSVLLGNNVSIYPSGHVIFFSSWGETKLNIFGKLEAWELKIYQEEEEEEGVMFRRERRINICTAAGFTWGRA